MWKLLGLTASLLTSNREVIGLYRHAVKGLSPDSLEHVYISKAGETFPDDRRYALLWTNKQDKWDATNPEWINKENFLCRFTAPQLLTKYMTSYHQTLATGTETTISYALPCDKIIPHDEPPKRWITVRNRDTQESLLGPLDLSTNEGRNLLGQFFSEQSGKTVICVTAATAGGGNGNEDGNHKHQFGNTSSGVKARGDTRTVHIVNAATVRNLAETIGVPLNPTRFRPNIVLDGLEPWEEFDWVGKQIACGSLKLSVIKQTVRCDGVSVDPLDPDTILDIPKLLVQNFPQHGPYFGVYAVIDEGGMISIGDTVTLLE